MRRLLLFTAVLTTGALVASACGDSSSGSSEGTNPRSQTLIVAENEPPASFDPVQADNSTVDEVALPAYDTLVKFDDSGALVPSVASKWTVAADGRSVDLTLRDDVTFHDGAKLTADDVKYTLDRIKKVNIGVASLLTTYASTTVTDPIHLSIALTQPYAPFVAALTRVYLLNAKLMATNAGSDDGQKWLADHDAGSGPYQVTGYTPNQEAKFTRYDKYWGGFSGQAKDVVFRYLPQAATQKTALQQGDIDVAMDIDPNDWASFQGNPDFTVSKADTNVQLYVFFKMSGAATSNKALREAIAYSYDYQQHVTSVLKGAGKTAKGVLPQSMPCFEAGVSQPTYDLEKAKSVLAAAGLSNVSVTMTYLKATAEMEQAATLLQSGLKQVGVDLKLQAVTFPQYAEMVKSNKTTPELGMIYAFPVYPDPDSVLYLNFDSKFINAGQNWGGYKNSEVDKLVEQAQQVTDTAQRCTLYKQAQQITANEYPTVNISNPQTVTVYRKRLQGYTYEPAHHQTVDVYRIKVS